MPYGKTENLKDSNVNYHHTKDSVKKKILKNARVFAESNFNVDKMVSSYELLLTKNTI